jgi:cytochrome c peroxidase
MVRIMSPSYFKLVNTWLLFLTFAACVTKDGRTGVELDVPDHFTKPIDSPKRNPLTKQGIDLGENLFFDTNLSSNGKVSCASCHIPELAFSDGQRLSSAGASHELLKRNSPALINLAWMNNFFWDGGVKNLESLPFAALTNPNEMGANLKDIVDYLNQQDDYKKQFKNAFVIDTISSAYVARALAQFQRTLVSANSKYDQVQKGKTSFSQEELAGEKIFTQKCSSCHAPPLFTDNVFHNNGIDLIFPSANEDVRAGRYRITLDSADLGKFKTPTLRNLKYTSPYMHDGRFSTLREVLIHYQKGIKNSLTVDQGLLSSSLEERDIKLILTFLSTLNDNDFVENYDK